jgi:Fe-S-cluster containining protein
MTSISSTPTAFTNYLQLQKKVDVQFQHLFQKHQTSMACVQGCHQCCLPDLTVSRIEADAIHQHLNQESTDLDLILDLETQNPHSGTRCSFLTKKGDCSIYDARPLVCRSHGVPHMIKVSRKEEGLDACELNFKKGFEILQAGDWIHLETLNFFLGLINQSLGDLGDDRFSLKATILRSITPAPLS